QPGETVLVVGATGGVGTAVIPLLAAAKARVIATATATDADLVRELGADEVIGYDDYPAEVDVAFNLTLPGDRLTGLAGSIRQGGRLLTITFPMATPEIVGRDDIAARFVRDMDGEFGGMHGVGELAARGDLRAVISRRYSLDDGVRACVDFVRRHTT